MENELKTEIKNEIRTKHEADQRKFIVVRKTNIRDVAVMLGYKDLEELKSETGLTEEDMLEHFFEVFEEDETSRQYIENALNEVWVEIHSKTVGTRKLLFFSGTPTSLCHMNMEEYMENFN